MHFKVSTVLPMPAAEFFLERDSAAFRSLVAQSANLGGLNIVEGWLDGETEVYRIVTKPDLDNFVPKKLQKHFKGGGLQYTDIVRYDPAKIAKSPFVLDVTSIPPILAERSRIECTLTIEDEEPGKTCRQTLEGEVAFRLMGLGSLAERIVVDSLRKVYLGIPAIVQRWVEFREEVLKLDNGREVLFSGRVDNANVPWITDNIKSVIEAPLTQVHAAPAKEGSSFAKCLANGQAGKAMKGLQAERGDGPEMAAVVPEERLQGTPSSAAQQAEHAMDGSRDHAQQEESAPAAQEAERTVDSGGSDHAQQGESPPAAQQACQVTEGSTEEAQPRTRENGAAAGGSDAVKPLEEVAHPQDIDGQTFFDAREEWDWREEEAAWQGSPETKDAVWADHAAAMEWYRQAKERGEDLTGITLEDPPSPTSNAKQHRTAIGRRFSEAYGRSHAAWDKFWAQHKVPKVAGVDSLAARLGHLLRLGTKMGAIKLGRSRKLSDEVSYSASFDASSPRPQPEDRSSSGARPQGSPLQDGMPINSQHRDAEETALPDLEPRSGERKHRTAIGKAISKLQVPQKRLTSSKELA